MFDRPASLGVPWRMVDRRRGMPAWDEVGVEKEHHRVFVLQWDDLFSETELDTWQVRTSNVQTILDEIDQTAEIAQEVETYRHHLPGLAQEALLIARHDPVLEARYPFVRPTLEELVKDKENFRDLGHVRRQAAVLRGRLHDYEANLEADLRALLAHEGGKEKQKQIRLTTGLATSLAAKGHSLTHLRAAGEVLRESSIPFPSRFDQLLDLCTGTPKRFEVLFFVQSWPSKVQPIDGAGITILRLGASGLAQPDWFSPKVQSNDYVVRLAVNAPDVYSARQAAEAKWASVVGAISFARSSGPDSGPALKLTDAIVVSPDGSSHRVPRDDSRRAYVKLSADWLTRSRDLLNLASSMRPEAAQQLSASLDFYRLAISHESDEVRLVNMWVATENLIRGVVGGGILERVTRFLPPLIALRNIRRVARGLVKRLGNRLQFAELRTLGLLKGKHLPPNRLIALLRDERRGQALMALLDHDPLLRYRLFRFSTGALKNSGTAADYIEANRQNVAWQLGRIYRARNGVIHRGQSPRSLRHLLQHLHSYLWLTIRSVSQDCRMSGTVWSIGDALENRRLLYAQAMTLLRARGDELAPDAALVSPDEFLGMRS